MSAYIVDFALQQQQQQQKMLEFSLKCNKTLSNAVQRL